MRHASTGTGLRNPARTSFALAVGFALALAGVIAATLPPIMRLETQVGLGWLFLLRGARPAPPEVVIVSIDHESSQHLGLPNIPGKWPRSLHARLIEQLTARGARAIVFDVNFAEARDSAQDAQLADAMRAADNVVLFEHLDLDPPSPAADPSFGAMSLETRVPPIDLLARAAAGLAPFPLPKVPARVSQVWLFKAGAGDVPTLPVLALQQYARPYYASFRNLIATARQTRGLDAGPHSLPPPSADLAATARGLREAFQRHPALAEAISERLALAGPTEAVAMHRVLLETYAGSDARYLDLYGPPRSITTVPYHAALTVGRLRDQLGAEVDLRDKAIFVGSSESFYFEQRDGFYTVFSQPDGLDMSGVEIAATTFANLLEGRSLVPLAWGLQLLLIAVWGLFMAALLMLLPGVLTVPAAAALAAGGMGTAYLLFTAHGIWLPVVVPLLLQVPLALGAALLGHYLYMRRRRERLHETLAVYLPRGAVAALAQPAAVATQLGRTVFGVCLATDIARYSELSEGLAPDALRALLNRYFELLFAPVRRYGGEVCDIKGDAMLAVWTDGRGDELRTAACRAALDIFRAVNGFGRDLEGARLPTRIGLHCGHMELGTVGSGDHFEYRPVGDIVNTATRIEGLSKHLGTWLLASDEVVAGLRGIVTREMGCFQPVGKSTPVIIHELLTHDDGSNPPFDSVAFNLALKEFRTGDWSAAHAAFADYLSSHERDGPTKFYLRLCARYQRRPPPNWDGTITLRDK